MARKIIVLEKVREDDAIIEFRYAFWADVPTARQSFYANATFESSVKGADAPSVPEINALKNGSVVERVGSAQFPKRDGAGNPLTGAQIVARAKADLAIGFTAYQAEVTAYNPWMRYGTTWDGTTWTDKTIS